MRYIAHLDVLSLVLGHEAHHVLGAEAVPYGSNVRVTLFLQVVQRLGHNGVDRGHGVRVVTGHTVLDPVLDVEVGRARAFERERVFVEQVGEEGEVPVCGELVGDKVCILRNAHHVWDEEDGLAWLWVGGLCDVDIDGAVVDGGEGSGRFASGEWVLK